MKNLMIAISFLVTIQTTFAQSQKTKDIIKTLANIAWPLIAEPYINNNVKDELTREIFKSAVPKLLNEDYDGAVKEVCNSISKIKNIKVLNSDFISLLKTEIKNINKLINIKDYTNALINITQLGFKIHSYLSTDILVKENLEIPIAEISQTTITKIEEDVKETVVSKMYTSRFDDYAFYISNGTFKETKFDDASSIVKTLDNPNSFNDQYEINLKDGNYGLMVVKEVYSDLFVEEKDLIKAKDDIGIKLKELFAKLDVTILSYEFRNYQHINNIFKCKIYHNEYKAKGYLNIAIRGSAFYQIYVMTDNNNKILNIEKLSDELLNSLVVVSDNTLNDKIASENQTKKSFEKDSGKFSDERDGNSYKWVKIGSQIWMAENLNYFIKNGSWSNKRAEYGRVYDWYSANQACPKGWHLPSNNDFETLLSNTGGKGAQAFQQIKQDGSSGFNAQYTGYRRPDGVHDEVDYEGYYWSSTEDNSSLAFYIFIFKIGKRADVTKTTWKKSYGFAVRCLKNK